jgi:FMN-dependent oxidoreductase (nitrilotriacetate monooxygenase family)
MSGPRQLHLNTNVVASGRHDAAWRSEGADPSSFLDLEYYRQIAQIAERGTFDAVFLADSPALGEEYRDRPWHCLEPTVLLAGLISGTERIGFVGTASTTFNHPYNIARRFASLDHLSKGRVSWNIVTTQNATAAGNFGMDLMPDHDHRYARAEEFVEVVLKLWRSWEEGAIVGNHETGVFVDPDRVHPINHAGDIFSVTGPLNVPRSAQGHPVLVQAGASDSSQRLGARFADAVFTVQRTLEDGQAFYVQMKGLAQSFGRDPDDFLVLPGLYPVIGGTEKEAWEPKASMDAFLDEGAQLAKFAARFELPPEAFNLDRPLPFDLIERSTTHQFGGFVDALVSEARRDQLTVRQLMGRNPQGGHRVVVGTPEQIADNIEQWFLARAADGFNLNSDAFPSGLEAFVDHVVPELRRRGIFRTEYVGTTLRDHFGVPVPRSDRAVSDRLSVDWGERRVPSPVPS